MPSRWGIATSMLLLSFLLPARAKGEDSTATNPIQPASAYESRPPVRVDYSIGAVLGVGGGDVGTGLMGGAHGELWLGDVMGIGLLAGAFRQRDFPVFGSEDSLTNTFVSGAFALRSNPDQSYGLLLLGPGYTHGIHLRRDGSFSLGGKSAPQPEYSTTTNEALLLASLGWQWTLRSHIQLGFAVVFFHSTGSMMFIGPTFQVGGGGAFGQTAN